MTISERTAMTREAQNPDRNNWHTPETCINHTLVNEKFREGEARMDRIDIALSTNAKEIKGLRNDLAANTLVTEEVRDILILGKSFFRLAAMFGNLTKWLAAIAATLIGLWLTIKPPGKL